MESVTSDYSNSEYIYTYIPWGVAEYPFDINEKNNKYTYMEPIVFPGGMHYELPGVFSMFLMIFI